MSMKVMISLLAKSAGQAAEIEDQRKIRSVIKSLSRLSGRKKSTFRHLK